MTGGPGGDTERVQALRAEMDALDAELTGLLQRRASLAVRIGREKARLGLALVDPAREEEILSRRAAVGAGAGPLEGAALRRVFGAVLRECRALVAALGEGEA